MNVNYKNYIYFYCSISSPMKRFLLLLIFTAASTSIMAQAANRIDLKHNGFVDAKDSTKNYVVLDFPKMSKVDLYKKTLTYLNSLYQNPASVISAVDGESITVNGMADNFKTKLYWYKYDYRYNITLQFKDGKIRFAPRFVSLMEDPDPSPNRKIYLCDEDSPNKAEINAIYSFSPKNKYYYVVKDDLKSNLDKWANDYVAGIEAALNDKW